MMANAKECDICKKFYKPKNKDYNFDLYLIINSYTIDLCPSCELELKKWYESRKKKK